MQFLKRCFAFVIAIQVFYIVCSYQHTVLAALSSDNNSACNVVDEWIKKAEQNIVKRVLENGITVVCYPMPGSCKVYVGVTYDVGSKDEATHKEYGFAHIVEHMLFKGTEKMSETDLNAIAKKFGIGNVGEGYNASTSHDATNYFFLTDKNNWPIFLSILADTMNNVRFDEDHLTSEKRAILNEISMGKKQMGRVVFEKIKESLYPPHHPYHHAIIGYMEGVVNACAQDLKSFYRRHYRSNKTLITITGDVDVQDGFGWVENIFGQESCDDIVEQDTLVTPMSLDENVQSNLTIMMPAANKSIFYAYKIPGLREKSRHKSRCLAHILNRRLNDNLKDEKNLVYDIAVYACEFLLDSIFFIECEPIATDNSKNEEVSKKLIEEEIKKLATQGPTDDELEQFKMSETAACLHSFHDCQSVAWAIEYNFFVHRNEKQAFDYIKGLQDITKEDVQLFCAFFLRPRAMHAAEVVPAEDPSDIAHLVTLQSNVDFYQQLLLEGKERYSDIEEPSFVHELPAPQLLSLAFKQPDKVYELSNGLRVYMKRRDDTPFINLFCGLYHRQARELQHDIADTSEIAHLSVALMNEGSRSHTKKENEDFFRRHGVFYAFRYGRSWFQCLPEHFECVADRFCSMLNNPAYPERLVAQKKEQVINRINKGKSDSFYVAHQTLKDYLYQGCPWHATDKQVADSVALVSSEDLFLFHKNLLEPRDMFLVIVGNYHEGIQEQLEAMFGAWKPGKTEHQQVAAIEPVENPPAQELSSFLPSHQTAIACGRITTYAETDDDVSLKLVVMELNKRLFDIREKTGLFYSCRASLYDATPLTKGYIAIETMVDNDKADETIKKLRELLYEIACNGINDDVLTTAQHTHLLKKATSLSSPQEFVAHYAYLIENDYPWTYVETMVEKVKTLSLDAVNKVARQYLDPVGWTFVKVGRGCNDVN